MARGLILEEIWNVEVNYVKVTASKIKIKVTRSRYLPSQYIEKKPLQGLMAVGLIVEEISNIVAKCVKVTGAQNIGQGHRVKEPAESVHLVEALCKVW